VIGVLERDGREFAITRETSLLDWEYYSYSSLQRRNAMFRAALLLLVLFSSPASAQEALPDSNSWADEAFQLADDLQDQKSRNQAFYRLTHCYARSNRFDQAKSCAEKVTNVQLQVYGFAFAARLANKQSNTNLANSLATQAMQVAAAADSIWAHGRVIELLLELDRVNDAVSHASQARSLIHQRYCLGEIARWHASHGRTKEALQLVGSKVSLDSRTRIYSEIASKCATAGDGEQAEKVLQLISEQRLRDSPIYAIALLRMKEGKVNEAKNWANQIASMHLRNELMSEFSKIEMGEASEEELWERFHQEKNSIVKIDLAQTFVPKLISSRKLDEAKEVIELTVKFLEENPVEAQSTKMGNFDMNARIAVVKMLYVDLGGAWFEDGELERGKSLIKIAYQAVDELDDTAGIAKSFMHMKLFDTVSTMKLTKEFPVNVKEARLVGSMTIADQCAQLVSDGKLDEAMKFAQSIKPDHGVGCSLDQLTEQLVERGEMDHTLNLLTRLESSGDIGRAYEMLGKAISKKKDPAAIEKWLQQLSTDVGRVHTRIGLSEAGAKKR